MKLRSEMYVFFDDEVGRMKLEFLNGGCLVHYLARASAVRVARRALRIWPDVMRVCKAIGFRTIEALFPDNAGLERLCRMCGFVLVGKTGGYTYMRCDHA